MNTLRILPLMCALGLAFGASHTSAQIPIKKTIASTLIGMTTGVIGASLITAFCYGDAKLNSGLVGGAIIALSFAQTAFIDSIFWRIKESYETPREEWEEADLGFHFITGIATFGTAVTLLAFINR